MQHGTPLYVLKGLGRWETLEIVKRYAHLAPEYLQPYAERVTLGSGATAQIRHKEMSDGREEAVDLEVSG